ncbi:hypothetical protein LguiA_022358 [Lonicera macranthoides]
MSIEYDYLPSELLIDILNRLPFQTLIRCTSVCKRWYSLITSPFFINTHLNRTTDTQLFMVRHCTDVNERQFKEQYSVHTDNNETFIEFAQLDFPFTSRRNSYFNIVATCNGLVCLCYYEGANADIIILWNPSLRKSVILPKPTIVYEWHALLWHSIGFGFDPVATDYKVVRLAHLYIDGLLVLPTVELFELSTASWRNISVVDFPYVTFPYARQAFLNGFVHWTGYIPNDSINFLIVSFDMRNESLGVVMAPPCGPQDRDRNIVTVFGESLSLLHPNRDHSWCLWVMTEYGVESSWTKHFTIDLRGDVSRPICFRENGDIILERRSPFGEERELVSYDFESKLIKNLGIHGTANLFHVDTYKESLVLAKGLNEILGRKENSVVQFAKGHLSFVEKTRRLRKRKE